MSFPDDVGVVQLSDAEVRARTEQAVLLERLRTLEHELESVTPFRRHMVREATLVMGRLDRRVLTRLEHPHPYVPVPVGHPGGADFRVLLASAATADGLAFAAFTRPPAGHRLLQPYVRGKATARAAAWRVLMRLLRR